MLKIKGSLLQGTARGEIVGSEDLALENGKVDLNLIKPTRMSGFMDRYQAWIFGVRRSMHLSPW
jgi:hypothetical protein